MYEYDKFLDTLQILYNYDDCAAIFNTLNVIAELMVQVKDDRLSAAQYINEFKHDRLKIKVIVEKKYL